MSPEPINAGPSPFDGRCERMDTPDPETRCPQTATQHVGFGVGRATTACDRHAIEAGEAGYTVFVHARDPNTCGKPNSFVCTEHNHCWVDDDPHAEGTAWIERFLQAVREHADAN